MYVCMRVYATHGTCALHCRTVMKLSGKDSRGEIGEKPDPSGFLICRNRLAVERWLY
jgi:hypothetical protein